MHQRIHHTMTREKINFILLKKSAKAPGPLDRNIGRRKLLILNRVYLIHLSPVHILAVFIKHGHSLLAVARFQLVIAVTEDPVTRLQDRGVIGHFLSTLRWENRRRALSTSTGNKSFGLGPKKRKMKGRFEGVVIQRSKTLQATKRPRPPPSFEKENIRPRHKNLTSVKGQDQKPHPTSCTKRHPFPGKPHRNFVAVAPPHLF